MVVVVMVGAVLDERRGADERGGSSQQRLHGQQL